MIQTRLRFAISLLAFLPAACTGRSSVGEALVQGQDGVPCFSTPGLSGGPVQALTVFDLGTVQPKPVWKVLASLGQALSEGPKICVPYGKKFATTSIQAEYTQEPEPLIVGRVYEAALTAPAADPTNPTYIFKVRFCLSAQSANLKHPAVHQVLWLPRLSRWDDSACKEN